jgi:hypothetical protein
MQRHPPQLIELSREDKAELKRLVNDGRTEHRAERRARVLLAMAQHRTIVQALAGRVKLTREAIWHLCWRYEERGWQAALDSSRSGRPRGFPPLARVQIEQLACCEPAGVGLHLIHWSTRSLAKVALFRYFHKPNRKPIIRLNTKS